ncbi:MAG: FAD-dependent oxidoreductase [Deltaproteobacteria bacterium]|nr:FAD-dependent oxidoreductase [Deltaproteobacteria bacterium]
MANSSQTFDVVVVGAGTAGAAAAYHFARTGRRTALVDRGSMEAAGARWVNGVSPWMFEMSGIPLPEGEEIRAADFAVSIQNASRTKRMDIRRSPLWNIDMRLLVARLHALGRGQGVAFFPSMALSDLEFDGDRPVAANMATQDGATVRFEAGLFVDASGLSGVLRTRVPALASACPMPERIDLCDAAQQVRRVLDHRAAEAWLKKRGVRAGETVSYLGVDGGFSTLNVEVDFDESTVELLTGTIATDDYKPGLQLIEEFVAEHEWIGEEVFGGSGLIPLRRPYDRFVSPGAALIGNAACQVFPAHGSGIGTGMIAAKMLAEACEGVEDVGALGPLWEYQATFMRSIGATNAAYDVFRKLSQRIGSSELEQLVGSPLMPAVTTIAALDQRMPKLGPVDLAKMAAGALQHPGLVFKMLPTVMRMNTVYAHYKLYPKEPDMDRLAAWARRADKLVGPTPTHRP